MPPTEININPAAWLEAFTVLGPFMGVAAALAMWQLYVVRRVDNRVVRTWLLCGSSTLILIACALALVMGYINSY